MSSTVRNVTGPLLVFIAALSWSTAGLFTRLVSTDIPTTLFWRSLVGGLCVLAIFYVMNRRLSIKNLLTFSVGDLVIASLSTAGMICFISAFFYTSIANVTFVYGTMPLITYVLALVFLKERCTLFAVACCAVSTIGMVTITYGNTALDDYVGIGLALGMTFFMASLTVAAKFFPQADAVKATYLSGFMGALLVMPFATHSLLPTSDYIWLGLYGLVNVGLGFGIYLLGVKRVSALTAALVGLVEIPLAPLWAWLLFSEKTTGLVLLGGVVVTVTAFVYVIAMHKGRNSPS